MEYTSLSPKKPENIALSFSGGGFRATSYGLGCLSYMERIHIEKDKKMARFVKFISSASGGTFTSLAYAVSVANGQPFDQFYQDFTSKTLDGMKVVDRVFQILSEKDCWEKRPDKTRNLINAFSIAYDELIFNGATFDILYKVPGLEICANTTEFDNAMLFRFQNAGEAGDKFLSFIKDTESQNVLKNIKLGDILACSSCFTVGFEPFMFPADFTTGDLTAKALQDAIKQDTRYNPVKDDNAAPKPPCFGLMDGGIEDNQGIDSFMLAEDRMQTRNHFGYDLYIACDVSSNYTSGYEFPEENKVSFFEKPNLLQYLLVFVLIFGVSLAGILIGTLQELSFAFLGISSAMLLLSLLLAKKGFAVNRDAQSDKNTYGMLIFKHLRFFLRLPVSTLLQAVDIRATSAAYLAAVVFLKKIRRSSYAMLFEKITERKLKADGQQLGKNEDVSLAVTVQLKHWEQFVLQNAIYLLSPKNDTQRLTDLAREPWFKKKPVIERNGVKMPLADFMSPSEEIQTAADLAACMATTLWYDTHQTENGQPRALIAAGQFTTCYNLLRYAFRFDSSDAYWSAFQNQLLDDWELLNKNPYALYV